MRFSVVVFLLALACREQNAQAPPTAAQPTTPTDTSVTVKEVEPPRNVTIDSPREGQSISKNPLTIRGTARTFENHVGIRLRDAQGEIFHQTFATAMGELGEFNPYEVDVLLTRWPGDSLTIEAFEESAKDGSIRSLASVTLPMRVETRSATLHFSDAARANQDCTVTVAVDREVPSTQSIARLLVEALLAGPTSAESAKSAAAPFPRGAAVRSVNLRDGILTVDFNDAMSNAGGSCRALALRAMLERTLGGLTGVTRVRITAEGREETALQP